MEKRSFTKKETATALEISARTIQFYTDEGVIIPEIANPTGRGTTRRYSRKNLVDLMLVKEMLSSGLTLGVIKEIIKRAEETGVAAKWDPDGEWGWRSSNVRAKLIVYDPGTENLQVRMEGREPFSMNMDKHRRAVVINVDAIFAFVDEI